MSTKALNLKSPFLNCLRIEENLFFLLLFVPIHSAVLNLSIFFSLLMSLEEVLFLIYLSLYTYGIF